MNSSSILDNLDNLTDRQKEQYSFISNSSFSVDLNSITYSPDIDLYLSVLKEQHLFFLDLPQKELWNTDYLFQFYQRSSAEDFKLIPKFLLSSFDKISAMISLIEPSFHNNQHLQEFMKFLYRFYKHKIPDSIVIEALSKEGVLIQYGSYIKNDYDIAMKAVQNNGFALGMLSSELRNNIKIVQTAILQVPDHYQSIYYLAGPEIHQLVEPQNSYKYFSSLTFAEELENKLIPKNKSSIIKI